MKPKPYINSNFVSETGKLGSAELIAADGTSLEPLTTPASAAEIVLGKEAYDDQGEKIEGTLDPSLPALTSPAAASDIISGKEAYDDQKQRIVGSLDVSLPALTTPATAADIAQGKEAYDDQRQKITGAYTPPAPPVENDVNYYDYDGTLLHSYTAAEFAQLTEHPANPTHEGLTAHGWNWTLADAKEYVAAYGFLDIGQAYAPSDGKTHIVIRVAAERKTLYLRMYVDYSEASIDWGDGSPLEIVGDEETSELINSPHTYAEAGDYEIVISGAITIFGDSTKKVSLLIGDGTGTGNRACALAIRRVHLGQGCTLSANAFTECKNLELFTPYPTRTYSGHSEAFKDCYALKCIVLTANNLAESSAMLSGCYGLTAACIRRLGLSYEAFKQCTRLKRIAAVNGTNINTNCFSQCSSLVEVAAPLLKSVTTTAGFSSCYSLKRFVAAANCTITGGFSYCYAIEEITFQNATTITQQAARDCSALRKTTIPTTVTKIEQSAFYGCTALEEIHFKPTTPPTVANSNAFYNLPTTCKIYVPTGSLSAYTSATNYPSSANYTYVEED